MFKSGDTVILKLNDGEFKGKIMGYDGNNYIIRVVGKPGLMHITKLGLERNPNIIKQDGE